MALIFTVGISSCKTTNQTFEPNPEFRSIKSIPSAQQEKPLLTVDSKNNQKRPEPKHTYPKLSTLQNLTSNQIHALLGAPSFKRSDNPAELWQYRNNNCTLDLFLYKNPDTAFRSVSHYEIRLQPDQVLTKNECFLIVLKASP